MAMKESTCRSAGEIKAQARFLQLLVTSTIEGAAGTLDGASTGEAITKEFGGQVKGGSIHRVFMHKSMEVCDVVMRWKINKSDVVAVAEQELG